MKHLPNILTLCNLFCGCIAITFIMSAPIQMLQTDIPTDVALMKHNLAMGSVFIALAALFDVFDGLTARMLNASSPIGKDLDSLSDVVSFGVAPGMILFKFLSFVIANNPELGLSPLLAYPAFILPCFASLRLAIFNQDSGAQSKYFKGMPSPASGMIVATLPLMYAFDSNFITQLMQQNVWCYYLIIICLSLLMVSKRNFLKWKAPLPGIQYWWPQILTAIVAIGGAFVFGVTAIFLAFIVYIISSLIYKYPATTSS